MELSVKPGLRAWSRGTGVLGDPGLAQQWSPKGYFTSQCFTHTNWAMWRIILLWLESQGYRGEQNENIMTRAMTKCFEKERAL